MLHRPDSDPIVIPEKREEICAGWDTFLGCVGDTEEVVYPEQRFTTWIEGGVRLNFTLSEEQVYNGNPLTVYLLSQPIPSNWDDFKTYRSIEEYQQGKLYLARPVAS